MTEVDAVRGRYAAQPASVAVADGRCTPTCGKITFEMVHCADCGHRVRLDDTKDASVGTAVVRVCAACDSRREMRRTGHA